MFPSHDQEDSELNYVSTATYDAARLMAHNSELHELEARIKVLEDTIKNLKDGIRNSMADLFDVHPDDLS